MAAIVSAKVRLRGFAFGGDELDGELSIENMGGISNATQIS